MKVVYTAAAMVACMAVAYYVAFVHMHNTTVVCPLCYTAPKRAEVQPRSSWHRLVQYSPTFRPQTLLQVPCGALLCSNQPAPFNLVEKQVICMHNHITERTNKLVHTASMFLYRLTGDPEHEARLAQFASTLATYDAYLAWEEQYLDAEDAKEVAGLNAALMRGRSYNTTYKQQIQKRITMNADVRASTQMAEALVWERIRQLQ